METAPVAFFQATSDILAFDVDGANIADWTHNLVLPTSHPPYSEVQALS